jgi:uncharacterized membrane protein
VKNNIIQKLKHPAYLFMLFATIAGISFIILTPPGYNDDERTHYIRVQQIANGQLFNNIKPYPLKSGDHRSDSDRLIGYGPIDKNAYDFIDSFFSDNENMPTRKLPIPYDSIISPDKRYHSTSLEEETSYQASPNSPFAYMPLVAGVIVGKNLGLSLMLELMLSKLFQLIVCIFLIFLALKILPRGKWILFAISVLPMTLIQLTAFTHDSLTYCFAILLFSYVYKIIYEKKKLTLSNYFILPALAIAIGTMKMTYFPIALLCILIPILNQHWKNLKGWILTAGSFLASLLTFLAIFLQVNKINPDVSFANKDLNPTAQMDLLKSHPFRFLEAIFNSIFFQIPDDNYYLHARQQLNIFGVLEGDRLFLQPWFMVASILAVFLAIVLTLADKNNLLFQKKEKLIFIISRYAISAMCLFLIYFSLYLAIASPGINYVWGVQTRYWLPFLPLLLIPQFAHIKLDSILIKHSRTLVIALSSIVLIDAIYSIGYNAL